jgi:hypothetical protein
MWEDRRDWRLFVHQAAYPSYCHALGVVYARNAIPFLLKLQALWKNIILTTNFVTDVWKNSCVFTKPCRTHLAERILCLSAFLHTQKKSQIYKYKKLNFKSAEYLQMFSFS